MIYGYSGKILRVDLTSGHVSTESLSDEQARNYIGGRGFNMRSLYDEIPPFLDGLDPRNKLFIGTSPLVGTMIPGAARFNVSAKSPQTGILGDSNSGGFFAPELKFAGYDQIILEGKAPKPVYLLINNEGIQLRSAENLWGLDIWSCQRMLQAELGDSRIQFLIAGPAAENGVKFAGLFNNLVRAAARTGMGTVMASKNVKAIAVRGHGAVNIANPKLFYSLIKELDKAIYKHPEYPVRALMGTTKLVSTLNKAGCLSTRHYQAGRFDDVDKISGEALTDTYKRKSKSCFSCIVPCSRFFEVTDGVWKGLKSEGPEFEGLAGFSSKIGVNDLSHALKGVDMCNRYGLDILSTAEVIAFAMELYQREIISKEETDGLELTWGNAEAVHQLITKIMRREGFGDILADGVKVAAAKIGRGAEAYAFHVKGLEFFQADPRGIKGYALGVAVASRGGDHLRSEPSFEFAENAEEAYRLYGTPDAAFRLKYKGKGKVVKYYEEWCALADCLEVCKNTVVNMEIISYPMAAKLLNAVVGWDIGPDEVQQVCERVVNLEKAFNVREGLSRREDSLPERFTQEPMPEGAGDTTGSVVELEPMLDEYYTAREWNVKEGRPSAAKLRSLGLKREADDLLGMGRIT